MKALSLEAPKQFRRVELPSPGKPGAGEALVRVHRVGVCGTDISGYLGKMPFFSYPRIPGHELGVEVLEVGPGVSNVHPGERCAVEPYLNCQTCYACQRGHSNCCEYLQVLGVHCDGGMRSEFLLPARKLYASSKLGFEQLALVETLGIGCHAVNRAAVQPNEYVLVIGAGPIGLSAVEFARLAGTQVILMDRLEPRLDFARSALGVEMRIRADGTDGGLEYLTEITSGKLAHVVIDATGNHESMSRAYEYVGFAGRLVFLGISTQEIRFAQPLMHRREMTFLASRNALPPDFTRIIQLIEQGKIDTRPWITHEATFETIIDEFPRWLKPESGVVKAMVRA